MATASALHRSGATAIKVKEDRYSCQVSRQEAVKCVIGSKHNTERHALLKSHETIGHGGSRKKTPYVMDVQRQKI